MCATDIRQRDYGFDRHSAMEPMGPHTLAMHFSAFSFENILGFAGIVPVHLLERYQLSPA